MASPGCKRACTSRYVQLMGRGHANIDRLPAVVPPERPVILAVPAGTSIFDAATAALAKAKQMGSSIVFEANGMRFVMPSDARDLSDLLVDERAVSSSP